MNAIQLETNLTVLLMLHLTRCDMRATQQGSCSTPVLQGPHKGSPTASAPLLQSHIMCPPKARQSVPLQLSHSHLCCKAPIMSTRGAAVLLLLPSYP